MSVGHFIVKAENCKILRIFASWAFFRIEANSLLNLDVQRRWI